MTYCVETDIEGRMGISIAAAATDPAFRPTTEDLAVMLANADGIINMEARVTTNMTDTYGGLKNIAIELVLKMINNLYSFSNPAEFPYVEVALSLAEKMIIHSAHLKFAGDSWELGD